MPLDHAELAAPLSCRSPPAEYHSATPVAVRLAAFGASSTGAGTARGVPGEVRHCSTHTHTRSGRRCYVQGSLIRPGYDSVITVITAVPGINL